MEEKRIENFIRVQTTRALRKYSPKKKGSLNKILFDQVKKVKTKDVVNTTEKKVITEKHEIITETIFFFEKLRNTES